MSFNYFYLCLPDSLWRRQSQGSFNTLTPFNFLFYSLHVSAPMGHPQMRYTISYYFWFWRTILIQRIRCTYAIWYRDVIWICSNNTCYQIKYKKNKIVKSVKFHVISGVVSYKSGLIYKNIKILIGINTFLYGVFISLHGGLGGPPSFLACKSIN
jgi:hypothetical protein